MKKGNSNQNKNNLKLKVISDNKFDDNIRKYQRELDRLSMKCDVLEKEVKYLLKNFGRRRNELDCLYEEHQRLINSKGYKFLEKLRKLKKIFTGENLWKKRR